ncbi:MAG: hypothetical protein J3K34DRAFT_464270 [Monoraphidium minutum]|nr:MAG: hypothetical protein J3K34DRAFT_464270 [Monoraphidium minutum]
MGRRSALYVVLLAVLAMQPPQPAAGAAGAKTIASALRAAGLTDCLRLVEAAGAGKRAADPRTAATVLCPTNQAIKAFAGDMGITLDELAAQRPNLVDKLVAYHIAPRVKASSRDLAASAKRSGGAYAVSGDPHYLLRFGVDAKGGLLVRDAQGRAARVARADVDAGASVVHALDRVLLSGEYFPDLKAFAAFYAGNFSSLARALNASGLGGALTAKRWNGTLFAPVDAAFAASKGLLAPGSARAQKLKPVLQYHQLPELARYPSSFVSGKAVTTRLAGHKVTVNYRRLNVTEGGASRSVLEGAVAPEAGSPAKPARIGLPNVYVARGVVHGIDGVLLPAPAKAALPPPPAPAGRRRLLRGGGGGFRGAGGFHPSDGGFGRGGGGRGFDPRPDVTVNDNTVVNRGYGDGGRLADAALEGAAIGASEGDSYNDDYGQQQQQQAAPLPAADYDVGGGTAAPSETGPSPGISGADYNEQDLQQQQQQQQQAQQAGCINCCAGCEQPIPPPGPPAPPTTPTNAYEDENGTD